MTQDEIIRMAREAGFGQPYIGAMQHELKRFAALVATHEREACANVCETERMDDGNGQNVEWYKGFDICATAIRARGER